jgi:hypothetical protein
MDPPILPLPFTSRCQLRSSGNETCVNKKMAELAKSRCLASTFLVPDMKNICILGENQETGKGEPRLPYAGLLLIAKSGLFYIRSAELDFLGCFV